MDENKVQNRIKALEKQIFQKPFSKSKFKSQVTHTLNQRQLSTTSPFSTLQSIEKPKTIKYTQIKVTDENNVVIDRTQGQIKPNN